MLGAAVRPIHGFGAEYAGRQRLPPVGAIPTSGKLFSYILHQQADGSLQPKNPCAVRIEYFFHIRLSEPEALACQAAGVDLLIDEERDPVCLRTGDLAHMDIPVNGLRREQPLRISFT